MKPKSVGLTTSELVILAIHKFESDNPDKVGCTPDHITQYLSKKYNLNHEAIEASVHAALFRGLTFGIFSQSKNRFRLEEVPEPPEDSPEDKPDKMRAYLIEADSEISTRKRKNILDLKENETTATEPWIDDEDEKWNCQLAKRRKDKSKVDEELSEAGFSPSRS